MDEEGPIETLRNVWGAISETVLFVVVVAIGIALVVMGNTLARLIGFGLLAVWLYYAIRIARRFLTSRSMHG